MMDESIFPDPEDFKEKDDSGNQSHPSTCTSPNHGSREPGDNWRPFLLDESLPYLEHMYSYSTPPRFGVTLRT